MKTRGAILTSLVLGGLLLGLALVLASTPLVLAGATFADPGWLHLGWLAPALVLLAALSDALRRRAASRFGSPEALARLVEQGAVGMRFVRTQLAATAILLLAIAAARPQWGISEQQVVQHGVDVILCLDTSKSMLAEDVKPNRLVRARLAALSLLERLGGDRVGLVAFAGEARVLCPLTLDRGSVRMFLDTLEVDTVASPGTALAPALELALRTHSADQARSMAVVLFTDGEDHEGEAEDAARRLAQAGGVVHAVGIGRTDGAPIPVAEVDASGRRSVGFVKNEDGTPVMTRLDAASLEAVAAAGGGEFHEATSSETELAAIAAALSGLASTEATSRRTTVKTDRAFPFLMVAFVLLALEVFLPDGSRLWAGHRLARVERLALRVVGRGKVAA